MIHEEKVRYMTQAACFEEKQRRKALAIMRYYTGRIIFLLI